MKYGRKITKNSVYLLQPKTLQIAKNSLFNRDQLLRPSEGTTIVANHTCITVHLEILLTVRHTFGLFMS